MIKSLTKLLNHRAILQRQFARFSAQKDVEQEAPVTDEIIEQMKQQLIADGQMPAEGEEGGQVVTAQQAAQVAQVQEDPYENLNLLQSNWKDMASLLHTTYYSNHESPLLKLQVDNKLNQIQALYNLDINNLDKVKILEHKEFEIRSSINAVTSQSNRYLEYDIMEDTKIGFNLMTGKRFRQLLENNNIPAIKQLYRNNEFQSFVLTADMASKIVDTVVNSNYENQFLINLLEYLRASKQNILIPNKNFQKLIQNIHDLTQVNKLKLFWKISHAVEKGNQFVRHSILTHELAKVKFEGFEGLICEKALIHAYSAILGKQAMKKLIQYSLRKFKSSFNQFIQFWALFNLLITRLINLNESSINNPHSLNAVFNLFELNLQQPKEIIAQIIPEALHQTKNRMLFEIYRVHAKFWIERKADSKLSVNVGPFDEFINNKIDLEESILVNYNPWTTQEFFPTRASIRTSKKPSRNLQTTDELLSETKMLEHLIRGNYSFILNHFLLVFNSGLEKDSFIELRKILHQAKEHEFTDENTKALYILKQINEKFFNQSDPVAFRQDFLTDFKRVKWLEKRQVIQPKQRKSYLQKMWEQDKGKFSRKRADKFDSQQPPLDNKERIFTKANKNGALFSKKNKNLFSTQKDSYTQYRQVVKDLTQETPAAEFGFSLSMDRYTDLNTFKQQIQARSKQMNENNHKSLFNTPHLPIVGSGSNLIKYLFLKKPEGNLPALDESLKKKLKVSFVSEIGALEKDFSQYLEGCRFSFPLAQKVYVALLTDQKTNYVRKSFKTIVTHMIAYKKSISDTEVQLICDICKKYRIGITLIQIYNLMIQNKVTVSREGIYIFCDSLQKFKKINGDIFLMTKKYCENIGLPFEVNMMSSYARSLLLDEQDEKLAELCETLKTELKPKPYKLKSELSAQQNIKQEKQYKEFQKKQYNRILNEVINMVVLNVNNKLPVFVSELFDEYQKSQPKLEAKQIAISLIVYCNNVEKFLEIIRQLKAEPEKIIITTYECALKALRLNLKGLEGHSEEIFNTTLFIHNFILNEEQTMKSVQILKYLSSPTVFIKFLEYLLRYNPPLNYEIKSGMYFIMNNSNDDFAKNSISGLLDFIFNTNREKEREEYRKAQIAEETKAKMLEDIEKKDFMFDKTEKQKEQIVKNVEQGNLEDAKKPKKNKSSQMPSKRDIEKSKSQAAAAIKAEKKKISLKGEQQLTIDTGDGILKQSNLKKKLRTKSLNDFEEMFAQKQPVVEQVKGKGKGGKQQAQQKDQKKKGK